jgi:UDP-N-acetylglucosamine 4,6-dehydratase/5-epimerase
MVTRDDARRTLDMGDFYIIQPDFFYWQRRSNWTEAKSLPEDFEYNSGTNPRFLTIAEMQELVREFEKGTLA